MSRDVTVIGCGVIGLSAAIRLLEAGLSAAIWARDLPPNTTSNVAAAFWHPYEAGPAEKVARWARRSFEVYSEMAARGVRGVRLDRALEAFVERDAMPESLRDHPGAIEARRDELPGPPFRRGWLFTTAVVETGPLLEHLIARVKELGGSIERRDVSSFDQIESRCIVNCTGVWAGELTGDRELRPLRGQVLRIGPIRSTRVVVHDEPGHPLSYVVPRTSDCVLGGTAELDRWELEVDPGASDAIFERCLKLAPEIASAPRLGSAVGLRPKRPTVRLERELLADGRVVIHDYGHGGAGVTLAWGCADEVAQLATAGRAAARGR
jgi:D-amino-acid oxidase